MSVRREVRAQLVAMLQAAPALAGIEVTRTQPGEDQALAEAIWVDRIDSRFDWRGLGPLDSNRSETLLVDVGIDAYREAPRQLDASAEAVDRVEELLDVIETTIAADPTLNVGATALVRFTAVTARPRQSGWLAQATCRIEIKNYPAT